MTPEFTIYSKPTCKYCNLAKALLQKHGRDYFELDITAVQGLRGIIRSAGYTTVPIIFKGDTLFGGYQQLLEHLEPDTDNPAN